MQRAWFWAHYFFQLLLQYFTQCVLLFFLLTVSWNSPVWKRISELSVGGVYLVGVGWGVPEESSNRLGFSARLLLFSVIKSNQETLVVSEWGERSASRKNLFVLISARDQIRFFHLINHVIERLSLLTQWSRRERVQSAFPAAYGIKILYIFHWRHPILISECIRFSLWLKDRWVMFSWLSCFFHIKQN